MNPIRLFFIILKEYLKKPGCIFIVLLIPILTALINVNENEINSHSITIGYYFNESDDKDDDGSREILSNSIKNYVGIYKFVEYDNINDIKKDILLGNIECGYIIPTNFITLIRDGKSDDIITVYISSKSTMNSAINETFYSRIFPVMSETRLEKYLTKKSCIKDYFKDKTLSVDDIKTLYADNRGNGSTFHFDYNGEPTDYVTTTTSLLLSPLKGLIGLMILISSLSGAFSYFKESESLIKKSSMVRITYIAVPTLLSSISAFITIIVSNGKVSNKNFFLILGIIILYLIMCTLFTYLLTLIVKSASLYASLIPMLIIGTIVFTPFIIDFGSFVPFIKYISYLFLPYYFIILL